MTFWFWLHIAAAIFIGMDAHRRGRRFIVWTALTLIPYAIFVTWPLLYLLPRLSPSAPSIMLEDARPALPSTASNKSFFVGVTVWVVCLIVVGVALMVRP
jgi:ABC-type sulfate transport system permease component